MLTKLFFACYFQARRVVEFLEPYRDKFCFRKIRWHKKEFVPLCKTYAKPGYCNLFLIVAMGDVFCVAALAHLLEKTYGHPVYFFSKPSHEFLFKMFGITNYQTIDFLQGILPTISVALNKTSIPAVNDIFFTHTYFQPIPHLPHRNGANFAISLKRLLGLPDDAAFVQPVWWPQISSRLKMLIEQAGGLKHIVLISPESQQKIASRRFYWWKNVSRLLHQKGFTVVCNAFQPQHQLPNSQDWKLSSEELIALGLRCQAVISIRSGLCDVLHSRGKDLFIIDAHFHLPEVKKFFNVNAMFGRTDIHEYYNELAISPKALVKEICATKTQQ